MTHPGLFHENASDLTEEYCHDKITELNKRMGIAYQLGRTDALPQLRLLLDHYQLIIQDKLEKEMQDIIDADPKLGRTVIDIDWPDPAEDEDDDKF